MMMNPSQLPSVSTISYHVPNVFCVRESTKFATTPKQIIVTFAHANGFCKEVWLPVMQYIQDNARAYLVKALAGKDVSNKVIDLILTSVDINGSGDTPLRQELIRDERWNANEAEVFYFNMGIDVLSALHRSIALGDINKDNIKPITIGVGHSMGGAATLHAEYAYPGSFNRMVLFEPVLIEKMFIDVADDKGFGKSNPFYEMTLKRKNWFPSKQAALDSYRGRGMFSKWSEDTLRAFVHGGFTPDIEKGSGVTLKCKREVEARTYRSTHRMGLKENIQQIKSVVDIVYGEQSTHFVDPEQTKAHFERHFQLLSNKGSKSAQVMKNATHYLIMEDIETASNIILESISKAIAADLGMVNQIQQMAKL